MNKIKIYINNFLHHFGYQLSKYPFSKRQIDSGYFKWLQNFGINTIIDKEKTHITYRYLFDPNAEFIRFTNQSQKFRKLKKNIQEGKNITLFNFALGDEEKETIINRNDYSPSSSLLELTDLHTDAFPITKKIKEENISIKVLDKIADDLELIKKVMMKIDVQGFELNVLRGSENTLKNVDIILIETSFYELYKNQPLFKDIFGFLTDQGFNYFGSFEQLYDERDGKILQADSIFIRS